MTYRPGIKRSAHVLGPALVAVALLTVAPAAAQIEVNAADPSEAQEAAEGTVNLDVTISGNGFKNGAVVTFLEAGTETEGGVAVVSVKVRGPKKIIANIDINQGTVPEGFDVQLFDIKVQLNGGVGKGTELFGVLKPEQGPSETIYDGAVGHDLGCLPCSPDPLCIDGDFHDVGTEEGGCVPLTCSGGNQSVACGRRGHPRPRIDLSGVFHLWDDPDSQGDPTVCFPGGIVDATVRTGDGGTISVQLFYDSLVDGTLPGRCAGATDLVSYRVDVESCTVTVGTYPPPVGEAATVSCLAGSEITFKTEGGGGIAKKCACTATGLLGRTTEMNFLGVSD